MEGWTPTVFFSQQSSSHSVLSGGNTEGVTSVQQPQSVAEGNHSPTSMETRTQLVDLQIQTLESLCEGTEDLLQHFKQPSWKRFLKGNTLTELK